MRGWAYFELPESLDYKIKGPHRKGEQGTLLRITVRDMTGSETVQEVRVGDDREDAIQPVPLKQNLKETKDLSGLKLKYFTDPG